MRPVGGVRPLRRRSPRSTLRPSSTSQPSCSATRISCPRRRGRVFVLAAFVASAAWQLALATGGAALGRVVTGPRGRRITGVVSAAGHRGAGPPYDARRDESPSAVASARAPRPTPRPAGCCTASAGARPTARSSIPVCSPQRLGDPLDWVGRWRRSIGHRPPLLAVARATSPWPSRWPGRHGGRTRRRRTSSTRLCPRGLARQRRRPGALRRGRRRDALLLLGSGGQRAGPRLLREASGWCPTACASATSRSTPGSCG